MTTQVTVMLPKAVDWLDRDLTLSMQEQYALYAHFVEYDEAMKNGTFVHIDKQLPSSISHAFASRNPDTNGMKYYMYISTRKGRSVEVSEDALVANGRVDNELLEIGGGTLVDWIVEWFGEVRASLL
uniref:Uncharacterized protein n=1 Tax=viral metagenome TaxID=1070528 RepID=A0A6C0M2K2_9ZZZZ